MFIYLFYIKHFLIVNFNILFIFFLLLLILIIIFKILFIYVFLFQFLNICFIIKNKNNIIKNIKKFKKKT